MTFTYDLIEATDMGLQGAGFRIYGRLPSHAPGIGAECRVREHGRDSAAELMMMMMVMMIGDVVDDDYIDDDVDEA